MPRKKEAPAEAAATMEAPAEQVRAIQVEPRHADAAAEPATDAQARVPVHALDPRPTLSVSLTDAKGGPAGHLLRSHKFNQMQIRFDGQQPDEPHRLMLKQAGWRDRTEEEGIWTKQIDREHRWQSVKQMEEEFRSVANAIRKDRGLEPAFEGLAVA